VEKPEYILLDSSDHPGWDAVAGLFSRMYAGMEEMGLLLPLATGGAEMWLKTAQNTSGKFGIVVLAKNDIETLGFAHGMIKFLPDYLGGYPVGTITHVFVDENSRRAGVGKELVNELEEWFGTKKVHSVELQVITGNPNAQAFWKKLGYQQELLQYRKNTLQC
jgi:ribosomal protein S18 acetylase RimI-like enzyme